MIKITFGIVLSIVCILGCSPPSNIREQQANYFDIKAYFQSEIDNGTPSGKSIKKTTQVDTVVNNKTLPSLDLSKELALFLECDINKPAWESKFKIDSTKSQSGNLEKLDYQSLDINLPIQHITLFFDANEKVDSFYCLRESAHLVAKTKEILYYVPQKGFSVDKTQQLRAQSPQHIRVKVSYQ